MNLRTARTSLALSFAVCFLTTASQAATKPLDPAYAQITDDPKLPRVLLIGDSVSVGYTRAVRQELAGKANVHRPPANCGSTKIGLRDLDKWLGAGKWDVIHFNWGLHDLGYRFDNDSNKDANGRFARPDNGGHQNVPPAEYEKNLRELVARLKKTGATLIFATTTPVPADLNAYVKASELPYNEVARRVMREKGIAVNDLWAFAMPQLGAIQEPCNPHFTYKGSQVLAKEIARPIAAALQTRETPPAGQTVRSPDGRIAATIVLKEGRPYWTVTHGDSPVIHQGLLGVETAPDNLSGVYEVAGTETASGDSTWRPVWGDRSEVPDRYRELTVKLRETAGKRRVFHVILRAYDEGVGLRYHFPSQPDLPQVTIKRRLTEYRFTANHAIYQCRNYEYGTVKIDSMSRSEGAVTVDLGDGRFAALTDADRSNFPVVFWHHAKDQPCTILGGLHSAAVGQPPFCTSWEVLMLAATAGKLYENRYLVDNLNPPCAIADPSWIRPGRAICQVRNTRMITGELKRLADFASAHKFDYLEIDHSWCGAETRWTPQEIAFFDAHKPEFWLDKPEWRNNVGGNLLAPAVGWVPFRPKADSGGNFVDLNLEELVAYANRLSPKVGICVYVRGEALKEFGGEHAIEDVFATYEKWGLSGVKPGFVPSSSQQNERTIAYLVQKAAEHKLIACIHDAYLPSGLSRTWPNLVNVEGMAGEEAEHSIPPEIKSVHDVTLPFTRGLMGPLDYTPELYKKESIKTHCHQAAMLSIYPGRTSVRGGMRQWSPGGTGGEEIEFVDKLPGLFDETRAFTKLGQYVTMARRRGETWFIASMSDGNRRTYPLPLDFLRPGVNYRAQIYTDVAGTRQAARVAKAVSSQSVVEIDMQPNGGHLMIVEPDTLAASVTSIGTKEVSRSHRARSFSIIPLYPLLDSQIIESLAAQETTEVGMLEADWAIEPSEEIRITSPTHREVKFTTYRAEDGSVGLRESWW